AGELDLTGLTPVTLSGPGAGDFVVSQQPAGVVAAGGSTTFQITASPTATGVRGGTVSIARNQPGPGTFTFLLQATGTTPVLTIKGAGATVIANGDLTPTTSDGTDLGPALLGAHDAQTFTIQNDGTAVLDLPGTPIVSVSGANASDFSVTQQP